MFLISLFASFIQNERRIKFGFSYRIKSLSLSLNPHSFGPNRIWLGKNVQLLKWRQQIKTVDCARCSDGWCVFVPFRSIEDGDSFYYNEPKVTISWKQVPSAFIVSPQRLCSPLSRILSSHLFLLFRCRRFFVVETRNAISLWPSISRWNSRMNVSPSNWNANFRIWSLAFNPIFFSTSILFISFVMVKNFTICARRKRNKIIKIRFNQPHKANANANENENNERISVGLTWNIPHKKMLEVLPCIGWNMASRNPQSYESNFNFSHFDQIHSKYNNRCKFAWFALNCTDCIDAETAFIVTLYSFDFTRTFY